MPLYLHLTPAVSLFGISKFNKFKKASSLLIHNRTCFLESLDKPIGPLEPKDRLFSYNCHQNLSTPLPLLNKQLTIFTWNNFPIFINFKIIREINFDIIWYYVTFASYSIFVNIRLIIWFLELRFYEYCHSFLIIL